MLDGSGKRVYLFEKAEGTTGSLFFYRQETAAGDGTETARTTTPGNRPRISAPLLCRGSETHARDDRRLSISAPLQGNCRNVPKYADDRQGDGAADQPGGNPPAWQREPAGMKRKHRAAPADLPGIWKDETVTGSARTQRDGTGATLPGESSKVLLRGGGYFTGRGARFFPGRNENISAPFVTRTV